MLNEIDIVKMVCQRLDGAKIPYMVTGSCALHFYSVPRMTRDLDIVVEIHKKDIDTVFQLFKDDFFIQKSLF